MCADVDLKATKEFYTKHKGRKKMRMYKVFSKSSTYEFDSDGCFWKDCLVGPYYGDFDYKVGLNISSSRAKMQKRHNVEVNQGFHLFRSFKKAEELITSSNRVIVPVYVDVKDLICVGQGKEVIFKKLTLTERAYKNALAELE